ncbi:MAG: FkbM family methyltransferase, partial [Phycisphaerae bacterium]
FDYLAKEGFKLALFGYGSEHLSPQARQFCHPAIFGRDMYEIYSRAKIVLNRHINISGEYANNMRLYEATGCGALLVTDTKKNLNELFAVGREIDAYSSSQHCAELLRDYLNNQEKLAVIAKAGRQKTLTEHSYINRMAELVSVIDKYLKKSSVQSESSISINPVSRVFGLDRGRAIDRFYIEKFLEQNKKSITGNVLEIGGDDYTKAYGQNVVKSDVLNAVKGQNVTIVGDLTNRDCLPENYFNSIILTQTLNFIYDVKNTIKNAIRALRPGGTLLITTAGISQISRYDMDRWGDYWRFTSKSLQKMFAEFLPAESFDVKAHGNVAIAKAFLDGLAIEDIDKQLFEYDDNDYQVVLTVRATKPVANVNQINIFGEQSRPCDTNYYKPQHQKDNNCTELAIPDNATLQDLKGIKNVALKTRFGNWKIKFGDITIYCYDLLSFYNAFKDIFYHRIYDFESNADCPTVIDGGGHIGLFTLYVKCKYPGAKITVFEPDGRSLELLRKNLTANGITDVKIVEAGLYKENTTLSFGSDNSDGSSIFAKNRDLSINVVRLSDYIQSPVDFVKLNIEGAELDVISEISSLLCNINELVFEYHGFSEIGQNLHKILPILADAGFRYMIHDFDSETNPATKPPFKLREDTRYFLLVCAKRLFSPVKHNLPIAKMLAVPQQPVILLYHRIADEPMDYQLLCTSPENFESHLKTLSQNYRVIRLAELLDEIKNNRFVPNTIALTFDDGYADNFTNALPLLEKYKIPATIFVTSGMVGSDRLFWWDAMEEIFLKNIQLPDKLRMEDNCGIIEWDLSTIEKRIETHDEICGIFRDKPAEKIYAIVNQLWFWAGLKEKQPSS